MGCGLDEVMRIMCILHCEFVGLVNDCGNIESVVRFADLFQAFVKGDQHALLQPGRCVVVAAAAQPLDADAGRQPQRRAGDR